MLSLVGVQGPTPVIILCIRHHPIEAPESAGAVAVPEGGAALVLSTGLDQRSRIVIARSESEGLKFQIGAANRRLEPPYPIDTEARRKVTR
jgi:hypothetical protein